MCECACISCGYLLPHKGYGEEVSGIVESFKQSIYFRIGLQLAGHYLMNKLHEQECKLPRVIDLKAHAVKL